MRGASVFQVKENNVRATELDAATGPKQRLAQTERNLVSFVEPT